MPNPDPKPPIVPQAYLDLTLGEVMSLANPRFQRDDVPAREVVEAVEKVLGALFSAKSKAPKSKALRRSGKADLAEIRKRLAAIFGPRE